MRQMRQRESAPELHLDDGEAASQQHLTKAQKAYDKLSRDDFLKLLQHRDARIGVPCNDIKILVKGRAHLQKRVDALTKRSERQMIDTTSS